MPNEQKRGARESHLLTRDKPRKPTETALCKPEKKVVPRQNLKPEKGNPNIPSGCIRYIETREQTHGSLQQKVIKEYHFPRDNNKKKETELSKPRKHRDARPEERRRATPK